MAGRLSSGPTGIPAQTKVWPRPWPDYRRGHACHFAAVGSCLIVKAMLTTTGSKIPPEQTKVPVFLTHGEACFFGNLRNYRAGQVSPPVVSERGNMSNFML